MICQHLKAVHKRRKQYLSSKKQQLLFYEYIPSLTAKDDESNKHKPIMICDYSAYKDFCASYALDVSPTISYRFSRGHLFFCFANENDVIAYGWLASKDLFWISEIDMVVDLDKSSASFLFDFYTNPVYRGKGWYGKLLQSIMNFFDFRIEKYIIYVKKENTASINGILKAGFLYSGSYCWSSLSTNAYLTSLGCSCRGTNYKLFGFKYINKDLV